MSQNKFYFDSRKVNQSDKFVYVAKANRFVYTAKEEPVKKEVSEVKEVEQKQEQPKRESKGKVGGNKFVYVGNEDEKMKETGKETRKNKFNNVQQKQVVNKFVYVNEQK